MSRGAIFLDRDGVINRHSHDYIKHWNEFIFLPDTFATLRMLATTDWLVVVVTNQSIVGRGMISRRELDRIHTRMLDEIRRNGGRIDAIFHCPHRPDENCACRKPRPGLLYEAARHFGLDLASCHLIGDNASDITAALGAEVHPWLVESGLGIQAEQKLRAAGVGGYEQVVSLREAVARILK